MQMELESLIVNCWGVFAICVKGANLLKEKRKIESVQTRLEIGNRIHGNIFQLLPLKQLKVLS